MTVKKQRLLTAPLLLFMGTMILANIAAHMHRPLLPLYLQELGAGVGDVGLFFTLGAMAPLAFQIFGGWLSDQIGRLQAIAIGSLGGVMAYVVILLAPSWQWLLISMVGMAISTSFVAPSFQAFIAEQSTEETRGRVYGLTETMFYIVAVIGPPLGGYLAQDVSFRMMFAVAGSMYASAALIRILMGRHARRTETAPREKLSFGSLKASLLAMAGLMMGGGLVTWIFISDGVRDTAFSLVERLMPLYLENVMGLTYIQIGWLTSAAAVATMLVMSLAGWLSDRKGERVGIVLGFAVIGLGWFTFLQSQSFGQFLAAWVVIGVGEGFLIPAYHSLISKAVPEKLRGTAFGLLTTSLGVISLPMPWIGSQLWQAFEPIVPFYLPLVAIVLLLPIIWFKLRLPANGAQTADPAHKPAAD